MLFLIHLFAVIFYLLMIIYACSLFTNAVENLGCKLKIGNNAIGSIFAVFGTSFPETIVPIIAIFGSLTLKKDVVLGQDIALGAIIGSPFILSTFALFLMGVVLIFIKRPKKELNLDYKNVLRQYKYFIFAYAVAILSSFLPYYYLKIVAVLFLLTLYCIFVYRTIIKSKKCFCENYTDELLIIKFFKLKDKLIYTIFQFVFSIFALAIFSHFFVNEIGYFSTILNINPVILSLIVTPFATELPECINSIIWIKNNKDDLAMANVLGGIVFQAMIPTSIGIAFTPWVLNFDILLNALLVVIFSFIFIVSILILKKIKLIPLLFVGLFYFGYLIYIFLAH